MRDAVADRIEDKPTSLPRQPGVVERWRDDLCRLDRESLGEGLPRDGFDFKTAIVLITSAVSLTLLHYVFDGRIRSRVLAADGPFAASLNSSADLRLAELMIWAFGCVVTYVVIPAAVIKLVFRERLADYGVKLRGAFSAAPVYAGMFVLMAPPVLFFSKTAGFQQQYPFYRIALDESLWPRFWMWECAYMVQFFALEFFFRGFMVHGTKHRFGVYSIFVMTVPYCMLHFGKPMPETFGAIGAGVILGYMSLRTRSIWLGAMLHVAVALSMDMLSLWGQGRL